jgi:hypothetical protein
MDLPTVIIVNPLQIINICTQAKDPSWLCKHSEARLIDIETKRYHCIICNPRTGYIKKCSQILILSNLRKE